MIKVKVKTIWRGKVAVRDKYIERAKATGQGITIVYKGETMIIPSGEIEGKIVSYSERPFADQYSTGEHRLVYFNWKPHQAQLKMLEQTKPAGGINDK